MAVSVPSAPQALCVGPPRLTAGLDRLPRVDVNICQVMFGEMQRRDAHQLITMAQRVDLRGRGGAAFPVARKLAAVLDTAHDRRKDPVVLVNGAEGEPGSAKDRMLLLRTPYLVLGGAMLAAWALEASRIVVAVADADLATSVAAAAAADPTLRRHVSVVTVPARFVSGEAGALVNAINGKAALPPGRKVLASDCGVAGLPTYLSNAETFAQLAVLAILGPESYATTGTTEEPGTVLLTVGGSAARPAVVEVSTGIPLGEVLRLCQATPGDAVLVGGYHGMWLPAGVAARVPVSRAGLAEAGGTLGAGVVLPLGHDTCPVGEVARVAAYLASESSGQCGPCALGLPALARALTSLARGTGGTETLDLARRQAAAVRGRGACAHPDGVSRFVLSALEVLADDIAAHVFRGSCGRPVRGRLPLPAAEGAQRLTVDWTRCRGHGLCAHLVPELVEMDAQGYPVLMDMTVPDWLVGDARHAVEACPALALRLTGASRDKTMTARAAADLWPRADSRPPRRIGSHRGQGRAVSAGRGALSDDTFTGLVVTEDWIAELSDASGLIPPVR